MKVFHTAGHRQKCCYSVISNLNLWPLLKCASSRQSSSHTKKYTEPSSLEILCRMKMLLEIYVRSLFHGINSSVIVACEGFFCGALTATTWYGWDSRYKVIKIFQHVFSKSLKVNSCGRAISTSQQCVGCIHSSNSLQVCKAFNDGEGNEGSNFKQQSLFK